MPGNDASTCESIRVQRVKGAGLHRVRRARAPPAARFQLLAGKAAEPLRALVSPPIRLRLRMATSVASRWATPSPRNRPADCPATTGDGISPVAGSVRSLQCSSGRATVGRLAQDLKTGNP